MNEPHVSPRIPWRLLPPLLVGLAFAHNLWLSWFTWGDLLVDGGRELELPRELLEGKTLYLDARCYYGPVGPLFNAFLYKIFGVHATVLCAAGIITAALICWVQYRLARLFVQRGTAMLVSISFLYLCGFAHLMYSNIFNYALPYSYSAIYGVLFSQAGLLFLIKYMRKQKPRDFYLAAAALGMTGLCKLETLLPALVIHAGVLWASYRARTLRLTRHGFGYGICGALWLGVYGYYYSKAGTDLFTYNILCNPPSMKRFALEKAGFYDLGNTLFVAGRSLVLLLLAGGLAWGCRAWIKKTSIAIQLAAWLALGVFALQPWETMFAGLTWLWLGVLIILYIERAGESKWPEALLYLFALAALARMPLRAQAQHYGFYMLPASLPALAVFYEFTLSRWLDKRFQKNSLEQPGTPRLTSCGSCGGAALGVLLCATFKAHDASSQAFALHTVELENARGRTRLMEAPGILPGSALKSAIHWLSQYPPETRVAVLPQGIGLTFYSGLKNPFSCMAFTPWDTPGKFGGEFLAITFRAEAPEVLVSVDLSVSEYGAGEFTDGYGRLVWDWVQSRYRPVARFPEARQLPGVLILVRSDWNPPVRSLQQ